LAWFWSRGSSRVFKKSSSQVEAGRRDIEPVSIFVGAILYGFCTGFVREGRETTDYTDGHGWDFLKNKKRGFSRSGKLSPYIFLKI